MVRYKGYIITPHMSAGVQYRKDDAWPWASQRAASEKEAKAKIDELVDAEAAS